MIIERLSEPESNQMLRCQCGAEMRLANRDRPATAHKTELRIFICPLCQHEMRLTVWSTSDFNIGAH